MKNPSDQPKVLSYRVFQIIIGVLGILLPFILLIKSNYFYKTSFTHSTISHYYYSPAGDAFVIILSALAIFLFSYVGYQNGGRELLSDNVITNVSGVLALLVVVFPIGADTEINRIYNSVQDPILANKIVAAYDHHTNNTVHSFFYIHNYVAILFILSLGYISYFHFTRSDKKITKGSAKYKRNVVYKTCGLVVFFAVAALISLFLLDEKKIWPLSEIWPSFLFCFECLALFAFGFSWLTKAELFFKDK
jgi:hypothetical protein